MLRPRSHVLRHLSEKYTSSLTLHWPRLVMRNRPAKHCTFALEFVDIYETSVVLSILIRSMVVATAADSVHTC